MLLGSWIYKDGVLCAAVPEIARSHGLLAPKKKEREELSRRSWLGSAGAGPEGTGECQKEEVKGKSDRGN